MILFEKVSKRYAGGVQALCDIDFKLEEGEMAFLTGHSGAGKSSLLKLITAQERPSRGQVLFAQRNLGRLKTGEVPYLRRQIGVIFQDHRLLAGKRVFDNVALPLIITGHAYQEVKRRVRAALDKVNLLHKEQAYPLSLSTGEQQRVGIARAIVNKPRLILADEPTGNLDPELSEEIMNLFLTLNELGTTVLIASHDLALIKRLGRRVLVLSQGQLIDDIPARSI
ncbi:MAG: cell division ATP-binding protein FtsE [Xanthomonadales bacterium]|jgi:cell division transport system ATP-binding protein|nr:cell division ATP-binding protein FtsE [Xanthomonadales bacterium]